MVVAEAASLSCHSRRVKDVDVDHRDVLDFLGGMVVETTISRRCACNDDALDDGGNKI